MSAIAGPSSRPDMMPGRALAEKNLLDHVNKIRQTPTFVGFEQVLRMTGDDWIDSMIEQAKDIRSKWAAQFEANSAHQQANMAGEMLKTPSRKKANARQRAVSTKTTAAKNKSAAANPFSDVEEEDKENAPGQGAARGTRSKVDKTAMAKLPNPFQAKAIAASTNGKGKAVERPQKEEAPQPGPDAVDEPAADADVEAPAPKKTKKAPAKKAAKAPAAAKKTAKGRKKKREDVEPEEAAPPTQEDKQQPEAAVAAAAEKVTEPAPALAPMPSAADDSMEVENTLETVELAKPTASTPTGKKIGSATRRNRLRLSDDTLAPIADAVESEEEEEEEEGEEGQLDGTGAEKAERTDSASGAANNAATTAPRQKRTLASFGGAKMSMAHAVQTPVAAKTPASSGFKSSFLTKSLRQASIRKTDDDDGQGSSNDDDSVNDAGSLKANTEANAAVMLGTKAATQSRPTSSKRKSDEIAEDEDAAQKATKTQAAKSAPQSQKAAAQSSTKQQGPPPNLLRSKIESARLQRTVNPGSVGIGAKGVKSPILGGQSSIPTSPDMGKSKFTNGIGMAPSSSNVSQLRDRFEASLRSPPPKAAPVSDATRKSPSRLPLPVSMQSTTPQHSPTKKPSAAPAPAMTAAPAAAPKAKPQEPAPAPAVAPAAERTEEVSASSAGSAVTAPSQSKSKSRSREASRVSDETTGEDDDGDTADDEREEEQGEDKEVTTKVARPLSGGQAGIKSAESTTASLKEPLGDADESDADSSLGVELTLEDLEAKKASAAASTATQTLPKAKAAGPAPLPAAQAQPATAAQRQQDGAAVPGGAGWSSRLKGLFVGITGAPNGHAAGPPPPGTGFQPNKLNRSVSGAPGKDDSTIVRSNFASSQGAGAASSSKPASVIRAEQLRRKEAEDAERRSKEREDKRKQIAAAKATPKADATEKRGRDDEDGMPARPAASTARLNQAGPQPKARVMSQFATSSAAAGGAKASSTEENGKKRRLTPEREEEPKTRPTTAAVPSSVTRPSTATTSANGARPAPGTTTASKFAAAKNARPGQPTTNNIRPASALKTAAPQPIRPGTAKPGMTSSVSTNNFSQQNPFQASSSSTSARPGPPPSAQRPVQLQSAQAAARKEAAAAPAAPPVPAFTAYGTTGTVAPNLEDDNVSLPSIASEYSDSEDEETVARRARAAPWTKGDALQHALQAQSQMDADLIFGVPTGNVDLETLMPPQDHAGRMRMNRPRSSSANWSGADGLAQWEIDRYNQRMRIEGPGFRLPNRPASAGPSGSGGGAAGMGQEQRRNVVATIGAAALARQQQQQQQQQQAQR